MEVLYANKHYAFELTNLLHNPSLFEDYVCKRRDEKSRKKNFYFSNTKMDNDHLIEHLCVQHCVKHIANIFLLPLIRQMYVRKTYT